MAAALDSLVDAVVTEAEIGAGVNATIAASRSSHGARGALLATRSVVRPARPAANAGRWTEAELAFARKNLGRLSLEDIGQLLGRTAIAIKIQMKNRGWPAPSKQWHELTAHQISVVMRKCGKTISLWIDLGILPGRVLPGGRNIHVVEARVLERWLVSPANWIYFDHRRIRDDRLRRLVELAKSRWPDRWLTTGQAARIMGCRHQNVNDWIHRGKIPARRWTNWHVLESVARAIRIPQGKGQGHELKWSTAGDAFLVRARAEGIPWAGIAKMMKQPVKRLAYRLKCLQRKGVSP